MSLDDADLAARLAASVQRVHELEAKLRPEPKPEVAEAQKMAYPCPLCSTPMERGEVSVHGTFAAFMLIGLSYQNCWFADASGREEIVLRSGHKRRGVRCKQCGFVGIEGGNASIVPAPTGHV